MNTKKFTVRMGGSQWVCQLNAGTMRAFEALSGKSLLRGWEWLDSVASLQDFLLATLRPEQPELTLAKLQEWFPVEEKAVLVLQYDILRGVCAARGIAVPAPFEAMLREALGEDFLAVLKAAPAAPSESSGPPGTS